MNILSGVRIIELASLRSGPYCTRIMADLGAQVIKIEDPTTGGDEARSCGPFPDDIPHSEKSGLFLWLNANKKGITLNLRTALGRRLLEKLLMEADLLVEDLGPTKAIRMGLDQETLRGVNPSLVVTSISTFGQTGPYRDYRSYEITACGVGGVSVASGEPSREPLVMPIAGGQYQTGACAAGGSMVALLASRKEGLGCHVDISEIEVLANDFVGPHILTYMYRGISGLRRGHVGGYFTYPNSCLPCKDGYVCLIAPQEAQWARFVDLMGNPDWSKEPRYRDRRAMLEQYPDEADALIIPWLKERTKAEIFQLSKEHHIPFAPVYTMEDLVNDSQLAARGFLVQNVHPEAGNLKYPTSGYQFSDAPTGGRTPAPLLGQHNEEVYGGLGYSEDDLSKMLENRII